MDPARLLYDSIKTYSDLEKMIDDEIPEGQFLECKSSSPHAGSAVRNQLVDLVSAFANSGGGVIIWGASTTKKAAYSSDFISQLEPSGAAKKFMTEINRTIPVVVNSKNFSGFESKLILKKKSDTKGIIISYIPPTTGDPIQSSDGKFYFRDRDQNMQLPYEMIKRMFAGSQSPDLTVEIRQNILKVQDDGFWEIPIVISNASTAVARDVEIVVNVLDFENCEISSAQSFIDQSGVNPNKKVFMTDESKPVHKGLPRIVGKLKVKMKRGARLPKRKLRLNIKLFSSEMRAREYNFSLQIQRSKIQTKMLTWDYLD